MEHIELSAQARTITGKQTKKIRKEGFIPAVIYSNDSDSVLIQLSRKDFDKAYKQAGHSTLVDLILDGKKNQVVINEVQRNPGKIETAHVMFFKVNLKEEIHADIPLEIAGESPAIKIEKGVLVTPVDTLSVRCLPANLPAAITVNISGLVNIGDSLTVADIQLPEGVELVHTEDTELVVATAISPQLEETPETTEAGNPEDVKIAEKGKKEEAAGEK